MASDECIVIERMYVCYKIKNKQKEWHPATKPLKKRDLFERGEIYASVHEIYTSVDEIYQTVGEIYPSMEEIYPSVDEIYPSVDEI
jgi:hypothetical protein